MSEKFRLDRKIGFQNTFYTISINVTIDSISPSIILRSICLAESRSICKYNVFNLLRIYTLISTLCSKCSKISKNSGLPKKRPGLTAQTQIRLLLPIRVFSVCYSDKHSVNFSLNNHHFLGGPEREKCSKF